MKPGGETVGSRNVAFETQWGLLKEEGCGLRDWKDYNVNNCLWKVSSIFTWKCFGEDVRDRKLAHTL